jgi:hypothetical protein
MGDMRGGTTILLYGDGFPTGTILDIEYIYHLEGTPYVNTNSGGLATGSSSSALVGSTNIVEASVNAASPHTVTFLDSVNSISNTINTVVGTIENVASSPVGRAIEGALMMLL